MLFIATDDEANAAKLAQGIVGDLGAFIIASENNLARAQEITQKVIMENIQDQATSLFKLGCKELAPGIDAKLATEIIKSMAGFGDIISVNPDEAAKQIKTYIRKKSKKIILGEKLYIGHCLYII